MCLLSLMASRSQSELNVFHKDTVDSIYFHVNPGEKFHPVTYYSYVCRATEAALLWLVAFVFICLCHPALAGRQCHSSNMSQADRGVILCKEKSAPPHEPCSVCQFFISLSCQDPTGRSVHSACCQTNSVQVQTLTVLVRSQTLCVSYMSRPHGLVTTVVQLSHGLNGAIVPFIQIKGDKHK